MLILPIPVRPQLTDQLDPAILDGDQQHREQDERQAEEPETPLGNLLESRTRWIETGPTAQEPRRVIFPGP